MRCLLFLIAVSPALADEPPSGVEKLFPLAVGNVWTYRVSGQEDRFVVRAVREEKVGDQTCVLLEASLKNKVVASECVAFTEAGLCRFREDKENVGPPLCVLRGPAQPQWQATFRLGNRTGKANFSSAPDKVTVPFGTFRATVVRGDITEGPLRAVGTSVWYAEGVGMVRQEIHEGKRTIVLELEKFENGKGK